jgi:hypothetical protein
MKKQKIKIIVGMLFVSCNVFIGRVISNSNYADFMKGFTLSIGAVLLISGVYNLTRKAAR